MIANHDFKCIAGNELRHISASFLVSYLYCKKIDKAHNAWKQNELTEASRKSRIRDINKNKQFHIAWLDYIANEADEELLSDNEIGLTGVQIKKMASKLLSNMNHL